jgi:hypothetical protein
MRSPNRARDGRPPSATVGFRCIQPSEEGETVRPEEMAMRESPGQRAHATAQPASSRIHAKGLRTPADVADYYSALTADLMAGVMTLSDADAGMREARKVLRDAEPRRGS